MSAGRDVSKQCDCGQDRWRKCDHAWHLVFRWQGRRYSISLDKEARTRGLALPRTVAEAEALGKTVRSEVESGTYQQPKTKAAKVAAARTFAEAWPTYVDSEKAQIASAESERGRYRVCAAVVLRSGQRVGDLPLATFDEARVQELYVAATADKAAGTKIHYRRALVRLFKWAARQGLIETNPITDETVLHTGKANVRKGRCKRDVEARLLAAADESRCQDDAVRLTGIIIMAIDCALRIGEILAVQTRDLLWDEGVHGRVLVRAERPGAKKNGKSRKVPLTKRVATWLRAWERRGPVAGTWSKVAYCYGDATGGHVDSVDAAFAVLVAKAHDIPVTLNEHRDPDAAMKAALREVNLHFRDLRREGALRWYHELGYPLNVVAELLGHSNMNTLRVYLGIDQETALDEAESRLMTAETGPTGSKTAVKRPHASGLRVAHRR